MNKLTIWLRRIFPVILIIILTTPLSFKLQAQQTEKLSIEDVINWREKIIH